CYAEGENFRHGITLTEMNSERTYRREVGSRGGVSTLNHSDRSIESAFAATVTHHGDFGCQVTFNELVDRLVEFHDASRIVIDDMNDRIVVRTNGRSTCWAAEDQLKSLIIFRYRILHDIEKDGLRCKVTISEIDREAAGRYKVIRGG